MSPVGLVSLLVVELWVEVVLESADGVDFASDDVSDCDDVSDVVEVSEVVALPGAASFVAEESAPFGVAEASAEVEPESPDIDPVCCPDWDPDCEEL